MQKNIPRIYCFVSEYNLSDLSKLSKNINIIYRNYNNIDHQKNIYNLKLFCKKYNHKLYLSNDIKSSIKLGLDGVYIPSFNKQINYCRAFSLPKSFKIIGSAHSISEIIVKQRQLCNEVFLSPVFKVLKTKKYLGVIKFNLIALNSALDLIALGGINQKNFKKLKLFKAKGFASISWAKKNGLRNILRPLQYFEYLND